MGTVLQETSNRSAIAQEPHLLQHLQGECAKLATGGDWDGVNVVQEGRGKKCTAKVDSEAK